MHLIHRGILNKNYQENNLKSFEASFKKGYGIETDIHLTKDHEFICFHDFTLTRIFKRKESVKSLSYLQIKNISEKQRKPVPTLKNLLKSSKNKYFLFIEIKPTLSINQIKKLLNETKKYKKCVFISFKHKNIFNILKLNKKAKVGLSFSPPNSIQSIIQKSKNKKIDCLILDKFYLKNKKINEIKLNKYFYTVKKRSEFKKHSKENNLIFENL